jgi:hypothetical protein
LSPELGCLSKSLGTWSLRVRSLDLSFSYDPNNIIVVLRMKKKLLAVVVSFGLFNAGAAFSCSCGVIESYGNLPNLQRYPSIFAAKVVDKKIGSTQDTLTLDINHIWRGTREKIAFMNIPKGNDRSSGCNCPGPTLVEWNFAKSLEKGKNYIFFGYQNELYPSLAIPLQRAQGIFTELRAIAPPESSNKSKNDVNGIPLVCHLKDLASPLYNREDREPGLFWLSAQYAATGDRSNALQIASQIEDAGLRANISLSLPAKTKDMNRFDEALGIMENQSSNQDVFLLSVIRQLVSTKHFDRAVQLVNRFKDSSYQREALEFLALKLVEAKKYDLAQQLVKDIADYPYHLRELKSSKGYVAMSVVESYLKSSSYDRAMETALKIDNRFFRMRAMSAIGRKYAFERNFSKALELAQIIEFVSSQFSGSTFYYTIDSLNYEATNRIEFLFQIASLAVKSGDRNTALQIADRENNSQLSSNILMAIALQYFKDGNTTLGDEFLKRSLETSENFYRLRLVKNAADTYGGLANGLLPLIEYFSNEKITYRGSQQEEILFLIAKNLIKQGKSKEAWHLIQNTSEYGRATFQWLMVEELINMKRYDEALEVNDSLFGRLQDQKLNGILKIAKKYAESGNKDKSFQLIQTALRTEPIPNYAQIVNYAHALGFDGLALEVVQKLPVYWQILKFYDFAVIYSEKGDNRHALEMLERLEKAIKQEMSNRPDQIKALQVEQRDRRNSFFLKLVKRAISEQKYDIALEYVDKMTDEFETEYLEQGSFLSSQGIQRSLLLSKITVGFAKSGAFEQAVQANTKIRDFLVRDRTWEAVAFEQSSRGNYREGLAIANRIQDRTTRSKLSNLLTCAALD